MPSSLFSYSLERSYPFKWFTPVVLVGGVVALALASLLSVATQGYETVSIYTPDPDVPSGSNNIFAKWPSFLTANTKPVCSHTSIAIGTQFLTNNTALRYTLRNITHSSDGVQPPTLVGSFPYQHNPFRNCSITEIDIEFDISQRDAIQIARRLWGAVIKGYVDCTVDTSTGPALLGLFTTHESNSANRVRQFANYMNITTQASLSMGESLLSWYSPILTDAMTEANQKFPSQEPWRQVSKGHLTFKRRKDVADVTSLDYFSVADCFFLTFNGSTGTKNITYACDKTRDVAGLTKEPVEHGTMPGIWIAADNAAKMFYWSILTDLGQMEARPNLLVEPELLEHFKRNLTVPSWAEDRWKKTTALGVSPSVIATSYFCQVPRLKTAGTLVVAVLINDIVLLSVLWRAFVLFVGYFFLKPDMMVCGGCACSVREVLVLEEEKQVLRISTV